MGTVKRFNEVRQKATPRRERDRQGREGRNARAAGGLNEDSPRSQQKTHAEGLQSEQQKGHWWGSLQNLIRGACIYI